MNAKLTLKLDEQVIQQAKRYAASQNRSLSGLVESYLKSLTSKQESQDRHQEIQISPFIKQMTKGVSLPVDINFKDDYYQHLNEKYT